MTLTSENSQSFAEELDIVDSQTITQRKSMKNFKLLRTLAKGQFGHVYLVQDHVNSIYNYKL